MAAADRSDGIERRRLAMIVRIARMYHDLGLRQSDIARDLGLSQPQVSRSLKTAAAAGYVRTIVVPPAGVHTDLEEEVRAKYGLRDVVIADATGRAADVRAAIGRSGAAYLETTVSRGDRLGISSWSSTLLATVEGISRSSPQAATSVVQLIGGIGAPAVQVHATRLAGRLARVTGARPVFVPAPGLTTSNAARIALLGDEQITLAAQHWAALDVVLVGIGALMPSAMIRASGNAVPPAELDELVRRGAVGDVCLRYFDATGTEVVTALTERVLGISGAQLKAIDRRVGIAGGTEKRQSIAAALRGGWVNILITDAGVARWLAANGASPRAGRAPFARP